MSLFVDTSVWSLALRRDTVPDLPEILALRDALLGGDTVFTTGIVFQELLQGFTGPKNRTALIKRFAAIPFIRPDREDHINAATLSNQCRRSGVQLGTIDALLAQLCIAHDLLLLSTDKDFLHASRIIPLKIFAHT